MSSRTLIIGGGLAGVATLYELARRGHDALLLEAADTLASGASFANGGLLTASMADPWNGPGVGRHLAHDSVRRTRELAQTLALAHDDSATGTLKVFGSRQAMAAPRALAEMLAPLGLRSRVVDTDVALALEPALAAARAHVACALHFPDDAAGDACQFTRALAGECVRLGAQVRCGAKVQRIAVQAGRVQGVVVDGDLLAARHVVIAAGVHSPALASPLGLKLPIQPAKGYTLTVDVSRVTRRPRLAIVDDTMHAAITPLGDRLRVAGTAEFAGHDLHLDRVRVDNLFRLLQRLYPDLAGQVDRDAAFAWTGLRPMSADGLPFIGAAGPEGLWVNAGHGHLGWTLAVGSGALLAALMTGERPAVEPEPYRVRR